MDKCRYIELFAGVGGFHVGLDRADKDFFKCTMANQWEPGAKDQFAANIYRQRFPDDVLINDDVNNIKGSDYEVDLLMGGFPCQDYSVAKSKSSSMRKDATRFKTESSKDDKNNISEEKQITNILIDSIESKIDETSKENFDDNKNNIEKNNEE